jgi:glycosyltransferase involved in cell wall biosynthesis
MKITFTTTFNSMNINNWSGTPFHMAKALEEEGNAIEYIGNLKNQLPPFFKLKKYWNKIVCGYRESSSFNIFAAEHYSKQVEHKLASIHTDVIISPLINPIAFLECKQPIILWTDALYAGLLGFYPGSSNYSASSIEQGNTITQKCLSRCKIAFFSSDWAARTAIEIYGTNPEKVKVVPYGANLISHHTIDNIREMLKTRPKNIIRFLFIGKEWNRKGGEIVFNVAKALYAAGQAVEVNFVGCAPPQHIEVPPYIICHGFISKHTPEGIIKLKYLLQSSHFLFVPSRAEAYGIIFCEANAFGLPCLTTHVGGISTIVKNNINGMTFSLDAPIAAYCEYIGQLMQNYSHYEELALSSFNEYETRLNWKVAATMATGLIQEVIKI